MHIWLDTTAWSLQCLCFELLYAALYCTVVRDLAVQALVLCTLVLMGHCHILDCYCRQAWSLLGCLSHVLLCMACAASVLGRTGGCLSLLKHPRMPSFHAYHCFTECYVMPC